MTDGITRAALTPARRRLVEMMQEINFGRIEGLEVRYGEPVLDPPPKAARQMVFGRRNGTNAGDANHGITLNKKVAELFEVFDREQTFRVLELVIDDGMPVRMTVADGDRT